MLGMIIGWLSPLIGISLGLASVVCILSIIVYKLASPPLKQQAAGVLSISFALTVILLALNAAIVLNKYSSAKSENAKLKGEIAAKNQTILDMEQAAKRKAEQGLQVESFDRKADVIYDTKYRTIEKIVKQPDLSLANRLVVELTTGFYVEVEDANVPAAK